LFGKAILKLNPRKWPKKQNSAKGKPADKKYNNERNNDQVFNIAQREDHFKLLSSMRPQFMERQRA
jgi:hypothetical protein